MTRTDSYRPVRRGAVLTEAIVALGLVLVLMSLVSQGTVRVTRLAKATRERQVALQVLQNQVGRLGNLDIAADRPESREIPLPEAIQQVLAEAKMQQVVTEFDGGWRIETTLQWMHAARGQPEKIALATWIPHSASLPATAPKETE